MRKARFSFYMRMLYSYEHRTDELKMNIYTYIYVYVCVFSKNEISVTMQILVHTHILSSLFQEMRIYL